MAATQKAAAIERENMKTKNKLYLLAVSAAALSLNSTTAVGQVFSSAEVLNNRAVAASPRAKEEFPWLARGGAEPTRSKEAVATSKSALAEVKENRALANSPRMKEQFSELTRPAISSSETTVATRSGINALTEVRRNRALAASPRMKEQFPELARDGSAASAKKTFEIAPVK
jgi:hypothetical protein